MADCIASLPRASRQFSKIGKLSWHKHESVCGQMWNCRWDVIATGDSDRRAQFRQWGESVCDSCLQNMVANQGRDVIENFIEVCDPSSRWRASLLLERC